MRIYKRILYLFLVSIILMSLTACESNNSSSDNSSNNNGSTSSESNSNTQSEYDQYNLLSFGEIEIDKNRGNGYYYFKVKITNNSDKAIRVISPEMSIYDKNNTLIDSTYPQQQGSIEPKQSFYLEGMCEENKDIDKVKINKYSYYIGNTFYDVDTLSKVATKYSE